MLRPPRAAVVRVRELSRALALPVYIPSFLQAAGQMAITVLLPLYVLSLGQPAAAASAIVGLWGVGSLLANLPAGVLVSRHGDRFVMVLALLAGLAAGVGMAFTQVPWLLSLFTFVFGASGGSWLLARLSFMTEAAPAAMRGRAISLLGGVQRLGGFVGPVSCGWLASRYGFMVAFLAASALVFAGLLLVLRFTPSMRAPNAAPRPDAVAPRRPGLGSQWQVLRDYRGVFATAGVAVVAIALVRSAYALLIPLWGAHIGLDAAHVGLIFSVLSGIDMLLFYPVGIVMDRWGRKWAGIPCLLGIAASLVLLPFTASFAALAGVALLCGFANGLGSGIVMTMGSDFAPSERRGEFLGAWRSLADIGTIGAPFLTSLLSATAGLLGACAATAAVGLLGALVMAFAFTEPLERRLTRD